MWTTALFDFLRDLAANNDRAWFTANKQRFEQEARDPVLRFIEAFEPRLEKISPRFVADARPSGGSLFRIYRDTRFSADKSPYKTHLGAQFSHEDGKDAHAPCFYLHLAPGEVFGGGGLWHPDPGALNRVREAIVAWPERWKQTVQGMELGGGALKRAPKGFDPEHPLIEDLKRKDFVCMRKFTEKQACQSDFLDRFSQVCSGTAPLVRFLTEGLGLPF